LQKQLSPATAIVIIVIVVIVVVVVGYVLFLKPKQQAKGTGPEDMKMMSEMKGGMPGAMPETGGAIGTEKAPETGAATGTEKAPETGAATGTEKAPETGAATGTEKEKTDTGTTPP